MPHRATKIVATLGPASSDPALLMAMINAGVNVVRLNFSHGKAQDHIDRATLVREAAKRAGREVAIMADLQGPRERPLSWTPRAPSLGMSVVWGWITRNCRAMCVPAICCCSTTA